MRVVMTGKLGAPGRAVKGDRFPPASKRRMIVPFTFYFRAAILLPWTRFRGRP
ncbi:protein of unknown function (plasmid) [Azospirillum baldaniorum]|uniref:Uncharacterized protein n=1 Tax=Azospirillum baldaniorum TaxID=1064539 RepID=A0A9P1JUY2_9PROT|nr:protein of unknown function [Azospirillum baldaniorum]